MNRESASPEHKPARILFLQSPEAELPAPEAPQTRKRPTLKRLRRMSAAAAEIAWYLEHVRGGRQTAEVAAQLS